MTLKAVTNTVAVDADVLIQLSATPNKALKWTLTGSTGTLTVFNTTTDDFGRASALFSPAPGEEGQTATIEVEYGA